MSQGTEKRVLPEGWRWVRLGDVTKAIRGVTFSSGDGQYQSFEGSISCITTSAVQTEIEWTTRRFIPSNLVSDKQIILPNDILVSTANSKNLVGKSALAREVPFGCTFGAFVTLLRVDEENDSRFVFQAMRTSEFLALCFEKSTQTTGISNLRVDELLNFQIPLPPLETQQRIADLLEQQLQAVEQARAAAKAQLEAVRKLGGAYLRRVFSGLEAQKWDVVPLSQVSEIVSGITLGRKTNDLTTREVSYLRVANVKDGFLDLSDVSKVSATQTEIAKLTLRHGDLLLTEGGDPDKLGRGTFWQEQIPECLHQNHIFRVRFDLSLFSPAFLAAQFGSSYGKKHFLAHAKQTTGIASINKQVLSNFPLLIPPLETQQRIASQLNHRLQNVEKVMQRLTAQLEGIEALPAALLRAAFSGQAVAAQGLPVARRGVVAAPAFSWRMARAVCYLVRRGVPGRVRHQKYLYLAQTHLGIALGGKFERKQFGPLDESVYRIYDRAASDGWFSSQRLSGEEVFTVGENITPMLEEARAEFGSSLEIIDSLTQLLNNLKTKELEAVTTLYAVWNDFLLEGVKDPAKEEIVLEAQNNWHPDKHLPAADKLLEWLEWMKENDLVPRGIGESTKDNR